MRKWISAAAAGMALMALVSCKGTETFDPRTLEQSSVETLSSEVTMRLSQEAFQSVPAELSLVITNHTGAAYSYGTEYHLEVCLDDQWYILPADEELYFTSIGVQLQPDGINSEKISPRSTGSICQPGGIGWSRSFTAPGRKSPQQRSFPLRSSHRIRKSGLVPTGTGSLLSIRISI